MINRENQRFFGSENMIVSDGFVIAEASNKLIFENSPFKRDLSLPFFYAFKINEGFPLVVYNSGESIFVYPKQDFDSINGDKSKVSRLPSWWSRDRTAYDLATFTIVPYDMDEQDIGWKKIGYVNSSDEQESSFGGSLLYVEHGMLSEHIRAAFHTMPSFVPNHFFSWMKQNHRIESYDNEQNKWVDEGGIRISVDNARDLTFKVNSLLEKRFETSLFLNRD